VAAGGAAAGLLLGGVITQTLGWHWNFFVNVPIGILALIGILKYIPAHEKEETNKTLDLPGAFLVTGGMMALVYAVGEIPMRGLFNPLVIWSFIGAIIALVLFIINESRVKHPLMPLSIFKIRNVVGGNIIIIPAIASMFGSFYFMSLYFQNILKYSPIMAGLSFLIFPLIIGIVSWNAPKIVNKIGLKNTLIAGTTLPIIGMALLTFIPLELNYWINVLPSFVLIPAGMGMFFLAVILAATSGVPARESGLVSGMVNTSQQLGGALGIAILSTIAVLIQNGSHDPRVVLSSFHAAFFAATLLMLVSLVVSMFVIKVDQPRNQKA
jgi:MFS family permease